MSRRRAPPRRHRIEEIEPRILFAADMAALSLSSGLPHVAQHMVLVESGAYDYTADNEQDLLARLIGSIAADSQPVTQVSEAATVPQGGTLTPLPPHAEGDLSLGPPTPAAVARHEIVFVDAAVPDAQRLIDGVLAARPAGTTIEVVQLSGGADGLKQISDVLSGERNLDAVHIVSHGGAGLLQLGNANIDMADLQARTAELQGWRSALTADADLMLYGCEVAQGTQGRAFVLNLARLTGADVAASEDLTGAAIMGGDFELEAQVGTIETSVAVLSVAQSQWLGVLAVETPGLWLSTKMSATTSAGSGAVTYDDGQVVRFTDPNLALGGGTTAGTFSQVFNIDSFAADGNADINGLHHVSSTVTVGTTNAVTLQRGDILLTTDTNETLGGVAVTSQQVVLFRPTTEGDYSAGTFSILLRNPGNTGNSVRDFALVETAMTVGGTALQAGDFLIVLSSGGQDKDVQLFRPTTMATNPTGGAMSVLVDGDGSAGIGLTKQIYGLELVQQDITLGSQSLTQGQLLMVVNGADTVGTGSLSVTACDVLALALTATGNGTSSGTATMLFRGVDVGVSGNNEEHDAVALVAAYNTAPTLNGSKSPALSALNEDSGAPSGAVGTQVSALVDYAAPAGQVDNVTDPDIGALLGIAVTAADTTNGTWWYSLNGGTNWFALGAVADSNARLLVADASTRLYFQPNANYAGTLASAITFRAWDQTSGSNGTLANTTPNGGATAFSTAIDTASVVVTAVNDAPTATNLSAAQTYTEDTPLTLTAIVASDVDSANVTATLTLSNAAAGSLNTGTSGAVTSSYNAGTGVWTASGAIANVNTLLAGLTFTPTLNFNGNFTIATSVSDGSLSVSGIKAITGIAVNDAPFAVNDAYSVNEESTLVVGPSTANLANWWNFNEGGSSQTITSTGTLSNSATLGSTAGVDATDPTWTTGYVGGAGLSFSGAGQYVDTTSTDLKTASNFTLSAWFQTNTTTGAQHLFWQGYAGGNGYGNGGSTTPATSEMSLSIGGYTAAYDNKIVFFLGYDVPANGADSIFIASASNFADTGSWHQVAVTVTDLGGGVMSASLYVDGKLEGTDSGSQNDRSVWGALRIGAAGDGTRSFNGKIDEARVYQTALSGAQVQAVAQAGVLQNDTDADLDILNAVLASGPTNGTLALGKDGSFIYTPNANFSGVDSFTYRANDGVANSNLATVTINVTAVNDAPAGTNKSATTLEDTAYTFAASDFGFTDPNDSPANAMIGVKITTLPGAGTLTNNGTAVTAGQTISLTDINLNRLVFTPGANANGAGYASFTFQAQDDGGIANGGVDLDATPNTMTISVTAVNDAPVITSSGGGAAASIGIAENTTAVTTVTSSDVDGGAPGYSILAGGDGAKFTINAGTGVLRFITAPDYENPTDLGGNNVYDLTVQISDGSGGTDTRAIAITVTNVADGIRVMPVSVVPIGAETRVNTTTTDIQTIFANVSGAMATDANGNFVIVWSSNLQDGSLYGVYAQRFGADGSAQGAEFRVNSTTADSQNNPAVAMDAAGNFVVTWSSNLQDGSGYGIYAQRYNATGAAQGSEFLVNTTMAGSQSGSTVAMAPSGDFVITWTGGGQDPDASSGVYAQRYNAAGVAQGSESRVNTYTTNTQQLSSVSMDAVGNYVVTWGSNLQDGSGYGVYGQRFNASGMAQGVEFRVNTTSANSQLYNDVAVLLDGRFVVAYQSVNGSGNLDLFMQRYAADGTAVGGEMQINTVSDAGYFPIPSVAADSSGNITVVWNNSADGAGAGVFARRYDWSGTALTAQFLVNTTTAGDQLYPEIVAQPGGGFIVAWGGNGTGDTDGVFIQRYGLTTTEGGGTATFEIVLDAAPTNDVTIPISVSDGTEGIVSVGSVTFNSGNWNVAQTVTITGLQDYINDGSPRYQVVLGAATSSDANFNGLNPGDLWVTNLEIPNTAPVNTVPGAQSTNEDTTLVFSTTNGNAISISDADAGSGIVNVLLSATNGTITLNGTTGLNFITGDGTGDALLNFTGTIASINTALNGMLFAPTGNYNGSASLQIITGDMGNSGTGGALGDSDTVNITVNPVADTPSVTNATTNEDTQSNSGLVISRNAADGAEVTHFKITGITNGTLYKNDGTTQVSDGSFITFAEGNAGLKFTPTPDFNGSGSFTIRASTSNGDAGLGGSMVNATITVNPVNDAPVATITPASYAGTEQVALTLKNTGLAISDVDAAAGSMTVTLSVTEGTLTVTAGGSGAAVSNSGTSSVTITGTVTQINNLLSTDATSTVSYTDGTDTPNASATLTLQVNDNGNTGGGSLTNSDTATINITAVNDAPTLTTMAAPVVTVNEDTQATISFADLQAQGNETDVDGTGSAFIVKAVSSGTLLVGTSAGTATAWVAGINDTIDATHQAYWTAAPNANGTLNAFTVVAKDNGGLESAAPVQVQVTVSAVVDTPSVTSATTNEDTQTASGLVITKNAADGAEVGYFQITGISNGTLYQNNGTTLISNGDFITAAQGSAGLKFTPAANFNGSGSFTVQASTSNGVGGLGGSTVNATITVNPVNDEQVIATNAGVTVAENSTGTVITSAMLATTDTDNSAAQLVYTVTGAPSKGTLRRGGVSLTAGSTFSQADINGGLVTYDHNGTETTSDAFGFSVDDGAGAASTGSFAITVTPVNDNPVSAVSDSNAAPNSVAENAANGSAVGLTALASDADAGASISYSLSNNAGGRFTIDSASGVVTVLDGSLLDYEAASSHTITVLASSSDGSNNSQSFTINLSNANDNSPTITSNGGGVNAAISVAENNTAVTIVSATDADLPAQILTYSILGGADGAKFAIDSATGVLSFVAAPNYEAPTDAGTDNVYDVIVQVSDGALTDTQAIAVTVSAGNDNAPVIDPIPGLTIDENSATGAGTLSATDADGDALGNWSIVGGTGAAAFAIDPLTGRISVANGAMLDFEAQPQYTLAVTVSDGTNISAARTMMINVNDLNEAPTTSDAVVSATEDSPVVLRMSDFAFNDPDASSALASVRIETLPTAGTLMLDGAPLVAQQVVNAADLDAGRLVFTPGANENGAAYAQIGFSVSDGRNNSAAATLTVSVAAVDDPAVVSIGAPTPLDTSNRATLTAPALAVSDIDSVVATLQISVVAVEHGGIVLASAPTVALSRFTVDDLLGGRVQFVGDGSGLVPAVTILLEDGGNAQHRVTFVARSVVASDATVPPFTTPSLTPGFSVASGPSASSEPLSAVSSTAASAGTTTGTRSAGDLADANGMVLAEADTTSTERLAFTGGADGTSGAALRATRNSIAAAFNNVALTFDFDSVLLASLTPREGLPFDWSSLIVGSIGSRSSADPASDASRNGRHWSLDELSITPAQSAAALLSAGFVWWSLRVAGLVTAMLASSPVWRHLDPVPILVADPDDDKDARDDASVPPNEEAARDESASRELFAEARRARARQPV